MATRSLSMDCTVRQIEDIVASVVDGETVMMSVENGKYYSLDPIGSRIWELIDTPVKLSELIDSLQREFEVDRETCERDVLKFLEGLANEQILKIDEPDGASTE